MPSDNPKLVLAGPTKRFFVDMISRDIDLADAILELVDNCVDGLKRIKATDYSNHYVEIQANSNHFIIKDNCGGITIDNARNYAFMFGKTTEASEIDKETETIGSFGIGMKRALFKMGDLFTVESTAPDSSFLLTVDVKKWASDNTPWNFEFDEYQENSQNPIEKCGTTISVSKLKEDIALSLGSNYKINELINRIKTRISYEISNGLVVKVNNIVIESHFIELVNGEHVKPYKYSYNNGDVHVVILAGMSPKRNPDEAGWYIYCNNRVIVTADQTSLTTWKDANNPEGNKFHNDFASFRGFVFFNSVHSDLLPWNTSKTGIDASSSIYQEAREHMKGAVKSVTDELRALNSLEEEPRSELYDKISALPTVDVQYYSAVKIPSNTTITFVKSLSSAVNKPKETTISFKRLANEVALVKSKLEAKSNKEVGMRVFDYFMEMEGLEVAKD